jgi:hypothetical protein
MKIGQNLGIAMIAAAFVASSVAAPPSLPNSNGVPTQMVVTVLPAPGAAAPESLEPDDLAVLMDKNPARVLGSQRLAGDLANMQLFVLVDDSARSSSVGIQLPELKNFVRSLPASAQVAVGYMRNGTASLTQSFTTDHEKAADSLRLPQSIPGGNGSPYFALSDLAKHWPSKESTGRRAVLMLTDGVDRYYGTEIVDDPYVDAAIHDTQKQGILVYSIYLRDAGGYDSRGWVTNVAQSRMSEVSQETGGYAYFLDFSDPVTISPFLKDFQNRLDHQYQVTIQAFGKGLQPVQVRSELRGVKIQGPSHIYVQ